MDIVDTHAHLYSQDESKYPMKTNPLRPPPSKGTLEHLLEVTRSTGVTKVVAIQTGSAYQWDNSLLTDTVKANSNWMAGVCTLNTEDPNSPSTLTRLVEAYGIKGLRVNVFPDSSGVEGFLSDGVKSLWKAASHLGIVICAHTRGESLETLAPLLRKFPKVPVVLDHCAYLSASEHPEYPTLTRLLRLKAFRNLYAKISFVVSGSHEEYPCRDTHALAIKVIEEFGADRCMWGSDFPTDLWIPKVTYIQHLRIFTHEMELSEDKKRLLLSETPMKLWFS